MRSSNASPRHGLRTGVLTALFALIASPLAAETTDVIDRSFATAPGKNLVVDVDGGAVTVQTSSDQSVAIHVERKVSASSEEKEKQILEDHKVTITQSGDTVTVHAKGSGSQGKWSDWIFGRGEKRRFIYTVTVPGTYNVNLRTSGGPVEVTALTGDVVAHTSGGPITLESITGPIKADTSGGPVRLVRCNGDTRARTSGGPIRMDSCDGTFDVETSGGPINVDNHHGDLRAHTSGGPIEIDAIDGAVDAETSGGPVRARLTSQPTGPCRLSSSGGPVTISLPSNAAFAIDAHTSGGGVHCDFPTSDVAEKSRSRLDASVNGGGNPVKLRTSGGSIHVKSVPVGT